MALYFAYGSNMLASRLRLPERAPSARPVGVASVLGFDLRFHKRGMDGSGKCDLFATDRQRDLVWGVVWSLSVAELDQLDRSEGAGYRRTTVVACSAERELDVESYVANSAAIDADLVPYDWYREIVVAGARESRLPTEWVRRLAAEPSRDDPDEERRARFLSLVS